MGHTAPFRMGPQVGPIELLATAGVLSALGVAFVLALLSDHQAAERSVSTWSPAGPPCKGIARTDYDAFANRPKHAFWYDAVKFGRIDGSVSCDELTLRKGGGLVSEPVCRFNNPTLLQVRTPGGDFFFYTGAQSAAVLIQDDRPRCILGAGDFLNDG